MALLRNPTDTPSSSRLAPEDVRRKTGKSNTVESMEGKRFKYYYSQLCGEKVQLQGRQRQNNGFKIGLERSD